MELIVSASLMTFAMLVAAACSALETALISTSKLTFSKNFSEDRDEHTRLFDLWSEYSDEILILLIIINVAMQMLFAAFSILAYIPMTPTASLAECIFVPVGFSYIMLIVFGKIIPKSFARKYSEPIAMTCIEPLYRTARVLRPFIIPFLWVLGVLHREKDQNHFLLDEPFITAQSIQELMEMGRSEGTLGQEQKEMISNIFDFKDRIVREIMLPRTEMICIEADTPLMQAIDFVKEHPKSRIPVFAQQKDQIIGIIYTKDMLKNFDMLQRFKVRDIMHKPTFINENMPIEQVLKMFRTRKRQMAIILDQFGGTSGLVTLEDVLEEIVGEIQDEHDEAENPLVRKTGEFTYIVDGKTPIYDLEEYDIFIHKESDYDTINGFLQHLLGRIPANNEEIVYKNLAFIVLDANQRKVGKLKITKLEDIQNEE